MRDLIGLGILAVGAYWLYTNMQKNKKKIVTTTTYINKEIPVKGVYDPKDWGEEMATKLGYGQEPFIIDYGFNGFTYPRNPRNIQK